MPRLVDFIKDVQSSSVHRCEHLYTQHVPGQDFESDTLVSHIHANLLGHLGDRRVWQRRVCQTFQFQMNVKVFHLFR